MNHAKSRKMPDVIDFLTEHEELIKKGSYAYK